MRIEGEIVPLGSVTKWLSGGTPSRANSRYWNGTIPWISAATLQRLVVRTSPQKVTPEAVRAGSRMAPVGSTLLLVRGSALHNEIRASLVDAPVCFNQDVKALVPDPSISPRFLTYCIHANENRLLRLVTSAGNTAGVLDTQVVKRLKIWLPPLDHQMQVVRELDAVHAEIESLERFIEKKKALGEGIAQELMRGSSRLSLACDV